MKRIKLWSALMLALLMLLPQGVPLTARAESADIAFISVGDTVDTSKITEIPGCPYFVFCTECKELYFLTTSVIAPLEADELAGSMFSDPQHAGHTDAIGFCGSDWGFFCDTRPGVYTVKRNDSIHKHTLIQIKGRSPNCYESGRKDVWACTCDAFFEDSAGTKPVSSIGAYWAEGGAGYIPASGHQVELWLGGFPSTCKIEGMVKHGRCVSCEALINEKGEVIDDDDLYLPLADHSFTAKKAEEQYLKTPADCTHAAEYYYSCSVCGEKGTETFTNGSPVHDFTAKVMDAKYRKANADCTHAEEFYYSCSLCGEKGTETFTNGSPLGHSFCDDYTDAQFLKTPADCTHAAEYYFSCSRCGEKDTTRTFTEGSPLGHDFSKRDTGLEYLKSEANCDHPAEYYYACAACGAKGTETFTEGDSESHLPLLEESEDGRSVIVTCAREGCTANYRLTVKGKKAVYTGEPVYGTLDMDDEFMRMLGLEQLTTVYLDENENEMDSAPTEIGTYYMVVPVTFGRTLRQARDVIEITEPIAITKQPESRTVTGEKRVYFTVAAEGENLTWQWQQRKPGSTAWANCVSGTAVTDTLAINAREAVNGYTYRCVVSDGKYTAISETATLTVEDIPVTTQPESQTVTGEKRVYFHAAAEGEGLTYQWQQRKPGHTRWTNCVSATAVTDTLAINARALIDGYAYRCVITGSNGSVISEAATLTVKDIPITAQPQSVTVTGEKKVYFTVKATGEGLTYQWQQRKPGQTAWCRCVSATGKTDTLAINAREAVNGYTYRCVISGVNGSVISETATLTFGSGR